MEHAEDDSEGGWRDLQQERLGGFAATYSTTASRVAQLGSVHPGDDGWDAVEVTYRDVDSLGDWLSGFGTDVVALEPPELRDAVAGRLRAAATGTLRGGS